MLYKHCKAYNSHLPSSAMFHNLDSAIRDAQIIKPVFISLTSIAQTPVGVWNSASFHMYKKPSVAGPCVGTISLFSVPNSQVRVIVGEVLRKICNILCLLYR